LKKNATSAPSAAAKPRSVPARVRKVAVPEAAPVEPVDTSYLRTLVGYNARRASLAIIESFMVRMAPYDLKVVDFSVLSLVAHNPGITSRQLCAALNVLPPNLVGLIATLERRGLIERLPHPSDGRAMGVHLTPQGLELMVQAEKTAFDLEMDATSRLTDAERKTLIRLLQKVYTPAD
jgi:DNA-binding MarR family transcriptional regulator